MSLQMYHASMCGPFSSGFLRTIYISWDERPLLLFYHNYGKVVTDVYGNHQLISYCRCHAMWRNSFLSLIMDVIMTIEPICSKSRWSSPSLILLLGFVSKLTIFYEYSHRMSESHLSGSRLSVLSVCWTCLGTADDGHQKHLEKNMSTCTNFLIRSSCVAAMIPVRITV